MRYSIFNKVVAMFVMVLLMIPISVANASEIIDINKKSSITIKHFNDKKPISNTIFRLYRVGEISEDAKFTLSEEFVNYNIDLDAINEKSKWNEVADTLATYIQVDKIKSHSEYLTKEDGIIRFDNLKIGVYLVVGDTGNVDGSTIKTKPFLVSLPNKNDSTGDWIYDVEVMTKNDKVNEGYGDFYDKEYIDFTVEKIWINDEGRSNKPTSIEVDFYRDDKVYDSIILNEENQWKYVWYNLDPKYNWTAVEKYVPNDYTVSYEKYSKSVKIKNTYNKPNTSITPPTSFLPQTGNNWIIAQGFALVGIILISAGYIIKRKNG